MIYVFWGLLNLFLFAGFVVIAYYALKLVRIKYGLLIAIVFAFMLLSFVSGPSEKSSKQKTHRLSFRNSQSSYSFPEQKGIWHIEDSLAKNYDLKGAKVFTVYETPLFDINLHVQLAEEPESKITVPVHAYVSVEGTLSGVTWEPNAPLINIDHKGENLEYNVSGSLRWKLMNMTVMTTVKTCKGSVKLDD